MQKTPCLTKEVIRNFKYILKFKIDMHHIYIQACKDPEKEWFPCEYRLHEQAIENIISEWPLELKVPIVEDEIYEDRKVWKE